MAFEIGAIIGFLIFCLWFAYDSYRRRSKWREIEQEYIRVMKRMDERRTQRFVHSSTEGGGNVDQ